MNWPTSPSVSAYDLSGRPSRLVATSRAVAQVASAQIDQVMIDWSV
jgi:hypothetical protein